MARYVIGPEIIISETYDRDAIPIWASIPLEGLVLFVESFIIAGVIWIIWALGKIIRG